MTKLPRSASLMAGDVPSPPGDLWSSMRPEDIVATLDRLTDGIFVLDPDSNFRYVNEPAASMLGRTRDELVGAHAWTLFPEAVGGPSYLAYEQAREEQRHIQLTEFYAPLDTLFEIRVYPAGRDLVVLFRDITGVHRAEEELREFAQQMSEAERIARFGVWKWDIASDRVRWSAELHQIYGVRPGEFGETVADFMSRLHPDDRDTVAAHIGRAMETHGPFAFEERILRPDGSERRLLSQGRVLLGPDGSAAALVGVCHDITERVEAERALGLSEQRMHAIIDNSPSVIAVKDLEGRYLMANAESGRLLGLPADAIVGELCSELFPPEVAATMKAADTAAVAEGGPVFGEVMLMRDGEPRTYVTVTFPLPDRDGRPREICTIGTDVTERRERDSERRQRLEWMDRIESALADERLVVFAQPVVEVASGAVASSELLIRMRTEDSGDLLQPAAFLPAAEQYGLIQKIDAWVLGEALQLALDRKLEVNLSAVTLCDADARQTLLDMLAAAPQAAANIVFEITETAALDHLDAAVAFATDITALGCGLALDDFGTGFGSFTYLRRLPLRYLKIDLSFVLGITRSIDDRRVVQSIIGIAEQFGLKTIAEGVEDQATLDQLREMGADFAQGFHLGRPGPIL